MLMKHKLALIGFSYLAGLICAEFFGTFTLGVFLCSALFLISSLIINKLGKSVSAAVALFTVFAAMCVHGIYTLTVYLPAVNLNGTTMEITGTITDVRYCKSDTAAYTIKADIGGRPVYIGMFSSDNGGEAGDGITLTVKLSVMKDNELFAEKSYYKSKGIFITASPKSDAVITSGSGLNLKKLISDYSDRIGIGISMLLPCDEGGLVKAMVLGDKSGLSDGLSENIKRAGASHFTAVSGLHLTVISHMALLLISLTPLKHFRYFKFSVLAAIIFVFLLFFKLSPSVIRAGIMLIVYYGAEPLMRKGGTLNSLGAAALLITIFDPYACSDAALLMSLAGTFGVGTLSPYILKGIRRKKLAPFVSSFSAILCTFPISCIYFDGFSAVGILTGVLLLPFFLPVMILTVLFSLLGGNGSGLMFVSGLFSKVMIFIINLMGGFKFSYFTIDQNFAVPMAVLAVIYTVLVFRRFSDPKKTLRAATVSVCVMLLFAAISEAYYSDKAKLTMYSDGQDACIIAEQGGSVFIVASNDSPSLQNNVSAYLKENFIDAASVIAVLGTSHNNLPAFRSMPCKVFLPPESAKEAYSDKISLKCENDRCVLNINGASISLSPAKEPIDDDIAVLYGYSGKKPELNGIVFISGRRMYDSLENNVYKSLYYDKASYIITDDGYLRQK